MSRFLAMAVLLLMLAGCAVHRTLAPDSYVVQRGDTLSAIGAEYGIDWHKLARWNQIQPPYRVKVGQRLWLTPYPPIDYAKLAAHQSQAQSLPDRPDRRQHQSSDQTRSKPPTLHRTIASSPEWSQDNSGSASAGGAQQTTRPSSGEAASGKTAEKPTQTASEPPSRKDEAMRKAQAEQTTTSQQTTTQAGGPSEDGWQWPATGSVLQEYDVDSARQGIEIGGQVGAPVYAASSGTVVYNGSGLQGYGKLIIIKHDAHYLSAYGFNERSLVKQGQTVAAGAHIADMGLGPGSKPMLHFEVRNNGEPIDPADVLPEQ